MDTPLSKLDLITIPDLFSEVGDTVKDLFCKYTYPWEILHSLKEYISEILKNRPEGYEEIYAGVLVGRNVKISDKATILAPAIIGDGCEIRPGAYLRGNVILGKGCIVGNSTEIKHSVLLDEAKAPHYNYLGDSIMGRGAHVGAGVIASNLKSDKTFVRVNGIKCYETGLKKMGAVIGDLAEIGCGCVLNPGTVIGKNTSVYPLTSVRGVIPSDRIVKSAENIVERI